ncbi:hypothetical protein HPB51_013811 [Rhipicephalus microplus]|uniref:Uncharacterized protein n=1 Tax=Rhipicephalus microplus TaxID=6941 RepID=A0A9J6F3S7_RHIMP|nr:hypothetical protein HPB51_013811 [Rhipicephalus microplus]
MKKRRGPVHCGKGSGGAGKSRRRVGNGVFAAGRLQRRRWRGKHSRTHTHRINATRRRREPRPSAALASAPARPRLHPGSSIVIAGGRRHFVRVLLSLSLSLSHPLIHSPPSRAAVSRELLTVVAVELERRFRKRGSSRGDLFGKQSVTLITLFTADESAVEALLAAGCRTSRFFSPLQSRQMNVAVSRFRARQLSLAKFPRSAGSARCRAMCPDEDETG